MHSMKLFQPELSGVGIEHSERGQFETKSPKIAILYILLDVESRKRKEIDIV